jgi:hypothetical protein
VKGFTAADVPNEELPLLINYEAKVIHGHLIELRAHLEKRYADNLIFTHLLK